MLESLRELPIVGDVRGAGYFHAIELVKDKETKESFDDEESEKLLRGFLSGELYRRGLICRADDRGDPVVQLAPPLIADTEQFEEIHDVLHGVLSEAWEQVVRLGRSCSPSRACSTSSASSSWPAAEAAAAPVRWVHISELEDPTPVALGRGADADHRHPARHRREAARVRPPARRPATSPGSASAPASATQAAEGAGRGGARSATSRSSRSPTRRRSSRSPRRPSPVWSTSSTRCCSAASPCSGGSSGWCSRSAGWRRSRRRSPPRSAAPSPILDGRGERLAGRGFRRQLSADAIGGDPQRGARPTPATATPSSPPTPRSPAARSPTR